MLKSQAGIIEPPKLVDPEEQKKYQRNRQGEFNQPLSTRISATLAKKGYEPSNRALREGLFRFLFLGKFIFFGAIISCGGFMEDTPTKVPMRVKQVSVQKGHGRQTKSPHDLTLDNTH